MNVVGIQASSHLHPISDESAKSNLNRRQIIRKKRHTCFEWTQLIATICIPLIIAVYTIIENRNNELIAVADRQKDNNIANNSRLSELEIAQANRLNDLLIAEQSRAKDRELAIDQHHESILVEYHNFLAKLILDNGLTLNGTTEANNVAKFMTLTTLSQLNAKRRGILIRSLYEAKLVTLRMNSKPYDASVLQLGHIDLSDTTLGSPRDDMNERVIARYIDWYYIYLPYAYLRNASCRHCLLDCATFPHTDMSSIDLSFATHANLKCFGTIRTAQTNFGVSILVNASLYKAYFSFTEFGRTNFTLANMREFRCVECQFLSAIFVQVDLSFSMIIHGFVLSQERVSFENTNFRQSIIHAANFRSLSFNKSDWSNVQASYLRLFNCTFANTIMENCSLTNSMIDLSVFQNASLVGADLSNAQLKNVSFVDSIMYNANLTSMQCNYCDFTNVKLEGAVLKNASLRYAIFHNSDVHPHQLDEAFDLSGSKLPNGTDVQIRNFV